MAWCRQATSHYPSQCWPRSVFLHWATRPQWIKTFPFYHSRCRGISLVILRFESFPLLSTSTHIFTLACKVCHFQCVPLTPKWASFNYFKSLFSAILFYFSVTVVYVHVLLSPMTKNMDCYKMESDIKTLSQIVDDRSHNEENMSPSTVLAD